MGRYVETIRMQIIMLFICNKKFGMARYAETIRMQIIMLFICNKKFGMGRYVETIHMQINEKEIPNTHNAILNYTFYLLFKNIEFVLKNI